MLNGPHLKGSFCPLSDNRQLVRQFNIQPCVFLPIFFEVTGILGT
jgi:hypothetical protein